MMYRHILLKQEDRDWQQYLKGKPDVDKKIFHLNTFAYGKSICSFFYKMFKSAHRRKWRTIYISKKGITKCLLYEWCVNWYGYNIDQAIKLLRQLIALLEKAKFQLRKWRENHTDILTHLFDEGKTTY